ncbi:MAG: hypothetical protein ACM3XM_20980 [Mycobacterium leprae]
MTEGKGHLHLLRPGEWNPDAEVSVALPESEALQLVRRAAAARALPWPAEPGQVHGVGGFCLQVTEHRRRECVAWATLGKNDGVLGLFSDGRLLATADGSLAEVRAVQPVPLPGLPHFALIVDDRNDQRIGAFTLEERRRIYVWDGHGLRQVFIAPLLVEQLVHRQWVEPAAPNVWRLNRTQGNVELVDGNLTVSRRQEVLEAPGRPTQPAPPASNFRLRTSASTTARYRWNSRLRRFDPIR